MVFPEPDEHRSQMPNTPLKVDLVVMYADETYHRIHPRSRSRAEVRAGTRQQYPILDWPEDDTFVVAAEEQAEEAGP